MTNLNDLSRLRIDPQRKTGRRTRKWLRLFLWIAICACLGGAMIAYPYIVPQSHDVGKVRQIDPEAETSTVVLSVTGYVIPHHRIELAPKLIARVEKILADKGDKVQKGAELVRLEDYEYRANMLRLKAQLAKAEAVLAE